MIIILIENTVWKCCFKRPIFRGFFCCFFFQDVVRDDSKTQQMRLSQVNIYYLTVISNLMYKSKCNKGLTKGSSVYDSGAVSVTTYSKGITVNPSPLRGSLPQETLISRTHLFLPHDLPPTKKSSTIKS